MKTAVSATNMNNNNEGQASALEQLRARIVEMKEAAYTYGDYSQEAVTSALDGVMDVIDELMDGMSAKQPSALETKAPPAAEGNGVDMTAVQTLVDYCDNECREVPRDLIDNAQASMLAIRTNTGAARCTLVPVTPTDDMIVAFAETWYSKLRCIDDCQMEDAYAAMLAAAPSYYVGSQQVPTTIDDGLLNEIELYFDANANVSEQCADFLERLSKCRTANISQNPAAPKQ